MRLLLTCWLWLAILSTSFTLHADDLPAPSADGLPPRTVPEYPPLKSIPEWTQSHLRIGHLPGSPEMAVEFLKEGYDVVTLNVLGRWNIVGPTAGLYPAERVKEAEDYLRTHVERCHAAGARAVFYIGPVQVPVRIPSSFQHTLTGYAFAPTGSPIRRPTSRIFAAVTPIGCSHNWPM